MTRRTACVVAILLTTYPRALSAQAADCDAIPKGPERTDCYIGLSRLYRAQSDLAAAKARVQSDAARYRQITGTAPPRHRTHRRP